MSERQDVQRRVGLRVAEARDDAGLTQAALANRIGMERTQLVRVEIGERKITVAELAALADHLGLTIDWFVSDSPPAVLSRRRDPSGPHQSSRSLDLAVDRAARDVRFLLQIGVLDFSPTPVEAIPASYEQAEQLAGLVRQRVAHEDGPMLDLGLVAEQLGLVWFVEELGESAGDGACVEVDSDGLLRVAVAIVNGSCDSGRRRWTLAHELGHFLVGDAYAGDHPAGEVERFINVFVAHLLMPRVGVDRLWQELADYDARRVAMALSARYRVSWSAACNQLRNLGRVTESERDGLLHNQPRQGDFLAIGEMWSQDLVPPSVPPDYSRRVVSAYVEGDLSADRTIELLRWTISVDDLPTRHELESYPALEFG